MRAWRGMHAWGGVGGRSSGRHTLASSSGSTTHCAGGYLRGGDAGGSPGGAEGGGGPPGGGRGGGNGGLSIQYGGGFGPSAAAVDGFGPSAVAVDGFGPLRPLPMPLRPLRPLRPLPPKPPPKPPPRLSWPAEGCTCHVTASSSKGNAPPLPGPGGFPIAMRQAALLSLQTDRPYNTPGGGGNERILETHTPYASPARPVDDQQYLDSGTHHRRAGGTSSGRHAQTYIDLRHTRVQSLKSIASRISRGQGYLPAWLAGRQRGPEIYRTNEIRNTRNNGRPPERPLRHRPHPKVTPRCGHPGFGPLSALSIGDSPWAAAARVSAACSLP